jgi:hypothetical protein
MSDVPTASDDRDVHAIIERLRVTLAQIKMERDWLLAEADDDTRTRFFSASQEELRPKLARRKPRPR